MKNDLFELSEVKKGNLAYEVTATGTINPINTVTVGTQVSGIVETVLADYNDDVKEGQILALLDSSTLKEDMEKRAEDFVKLNPIISVISDILSVKSLISSSLRIVVKVIYLSSNNQILFVYKNS